MMLPLWASSAFIQQPDIALNTEMAPLLSPMIILRWFGSKHMAAMSALPLFTLDKNTNMEQAELTRHKFAELGLEASGKRVPRADLWWSRRHELELLRVEGAGDEPFALSNWELFFPSHVRMTRGLVDLTEKLLGTWRRSRVNERFVVRCRSAPQRGCRASGTRPACHEHQPTPSPARIGSWDECPRSSSFY